MITICHSMRRNLASIVIAAAISPSIGLAAEAAGGGAKGGAAKGGGAAAAPAVSHAAAAPAQASAPQASAPQASAAKAAAQAPAQSSSQTPSQTPSQATVQQPIQSPSQATGQVNPQTPTQSPSQSSAQVSTGAPGAPAARPGSNIGNPNVGSRDDRRHHAPDGTFLIPGYYGTNYWDSGYVNNQSQFYGQYNQNENGYTNQQSQQQTQAQNPQPQNADQTPAFYEPPGQADSPSLATALAASPAYAQADAQARAAQTNYDAISERVIAKLKQTPEYQKAAANKSADASKLSSMKASDPTASPEKAEPAAQEKLDAAKAVSDMERQALAADPQAVAAKMKLDEAVANRNAVRAHVQASMPNMAAMKH